MTRSRTRDKSEVRGKRRFDSPSAVDIDAGSKLIAVWSASGSNGRSTIAAALARAFAAADSSREVLLVDADSLAPSQHLLHGLTEVTSGILGAARLVRQDRYDDHEHERLTNAVAGYRLMTGIPVLSRWPELDEYALGLLVHELAGRAPIAIFDVAAPLDQEVVEPSLGQRRNQATLSVLSRSDVVLAVGNADPVSIARLVEALPELERLVAGRVIVVINRMRTEAIARDARKQIEAIFAGRQVAYVVNDPKACDDALREGQNPLVIRPRSDLARSIRELASRINSTHADSARAHQTERQS